MGKVLTFLLLWLLPQLRTGRSKAVPVVASGPTAVAGSGGAERVSPDRVCHPDPAHAAGQAEPPGRGEAQLWDSGGYRLGPEVTPVQQVRKPTLPALVGLSCPGRGVTLKQAFDLGHIGF